MSTQRTWSLISFLTAISVSQISAVNACDVFADDPRLSKPLRILLKDASVSAMLPQLTKATGVPLLWDKEIADLRASAFAQAQPASRVLTYVAACLRLVWKREADGYRLYRPTALTRDDEQRRRQREERQAKRIEELRQMDEFSAALVRQSHLTDAEVKALVAKFSYVAKMVEETPGLIVGLRVITWLTPEQWDKVATDGLRLDYKEWTLTGPDPDLPAPTLTPETVKGMEEFLRRQGKEPGNIAIIKPPGRSGINNVYMRVQPEGNLVVELAYSISGGFGQEISFRLGSVRDKR
jgi:hypothetical protein